MLLTKKAKEFFNSLLTIIITHLVKFMAKAEVIDKNILNLQVPADLTAIASRETSDKLSELHKQQTERNKQLDEQYSNTNQKTDQLLKMVNQLGQLIGSVGSIVQYIAQRPPVYFYINDKGHSFSLLQIQKLYFSISLKGKTKLQIELYVNQTQIDSWSLDLEVWRRNLMKDIPAPDQEVKSPEEAKKIEDDKKQLELVEYGMTKLVKTDFLYRTMKVAPIYLVNTIIENRTVLGANIVEGVLHSAFLQVAEEFRTEEQEQDRIKEEEEKKKQEELEKKSPHLVFVKTENPDNLPEDLLRTEQRLFDEAAAKENDITELREALLKGENPIPEADQGLSVDEAEAALEEEIDKAFGIDKAEEQAAELQEYDYEVIDENATIERDPQVCCGARPE